MKTRTFKRRKMFVLTVTFTLLLTGTYAWTSISQRATNELENRNTHHGGRVHDDFDGENKDVYAENFGTSDLYVRIKLTEYMEINGVPLVTGTKRTNKETWIANVLGVPSACRSYVEWTRGGEKVFMPTLNTNPEDGISDASGIAIDDMTGTQTAPGNGSHDFWTIGDVHPNYNPNSGVEAKPAKATNSPQRNGYMTMQDWITAEKPVGNFWVIDVDGWAYWGTKLAPGEATSLLLDSIAMVYEPEDAWYYGIHVIGEFSSASDVHNFEGLTEQARALITKVAGVSRYEIQLTQENDTVTKGSTHIVLGKVTDKGIDIVDPVIVWTIVSPHTQGTTIDSMGVVTVANDETTKTMIVRATYQDTSKDITFTITP